jgi:hypothetical protein
MTNLVWPNQTQLICQLDVVYAWSGNCLNGEHAVMVELQELNRPLTTPAPNAQGALGTWSNHRQSGCAHHNASNAWELLADRKHTVMVELQELNRPLTTPAPNAQGALGTWSNHCPSGCAHHNASNAW